jgi:hypothetical protein
LACHLKIDADPDPGLAYHFHPDPDPAYHFDADPDPDATFQFNADLCGSGSITLAAKVTERRRRGLQSSRYETLLAITKGGREGGGIYVSVCLFKRF